MTIHPVHVVYRRIEVATHHLCVGARHWHGATDEVSRGGGDLSRLLLKQAIARLSGTTDAHRAHRIDLKSSLMLRTEVKAGIGN